MKTGTIRCWLFGHKFVKHYRDWDGNLYYPHFEPMTFCVRCGINKEQDG